MNTMNRTQTHVPAVALGMAGHLPHLVDQARPHPDDDRHTAPLTDENAGYLPEFIVECARLGLPFELTLDPDVDLPEIRSINGVRTVLARADEIGVALDDVRFIGRCIDCRTDLDDTAVPFDCAELGSTHITGDPIRICRACSKERAEASAARIERHVDSILAALRAAVPVVLARTGLDVGSETAEAIAEDIAVRLGVPVTSPAGGVR